MNTPINLYNRQDPNTPEKLLLERLEIILRKDFISGYSYCGDQEEVCGTRSDIDDAYSAGAQEVKRYLSDALGIYAFERNMYKEEN